MKGKGGIIGGIITLVIGGTVFSISKADIAKNLSKDTGLTQEEAQQYIEKVTNDDLVPYDKLGSDLISEGQSILNSSRDIDCVNYTYKWETSTLPCTKGKAQLVTLGNDEIELGKAYKILSTDSASENDISLVISKINSLNLDFKFEIVTQMLDAKTVDEMTKTNSYNKAVLQAALDSKK